MTNGATYIRKRLSLGLPIDLYEDLREEALKERISIADVIRYKIFRFNDLSSKEMEKLSSPVQVPKQEDELKAVCFEILFLLREFLFERNAQILRKVDERLDKQLGNDRNKFV